MKKILRILFILMLFLSACGNEVVQEEQEIVADDNTQEELSVQEDKCSACNDNNKCTEDVCGEDTNYECRYQAITPCCGNDVCEDSEDYEACPTDCEKPKSEEVTKILAGQQKIKSYKYTRWTDEIAGFISVKNDMIRLDLTDTHRQELNAEYKAEFDTIVIDTAAKTAIAFCEDISCEDKATTQELDYTDYVPTLPMDIIEGASYGSDIVSTETCDNSKPCSKIEVTFEDGSEGYVWLDSYYGFPFKIEKGGELIEYQNVVVNSVKDEEFETP